MKSNNYFSNYISINKFNKKWNKLFIFFMTYFKKYNYSNFIIYIVKFIHSNKNFFLILFIIASWFWSNLLLNIVGNFVLIDSLIISLLVLQNNSVTQNSRRLCKNIILYSISQLNIIGGVFTLICILFIYMEYSKFINRILFKIIKFIIKTISSIFPSICYFYPDIKLFNFEDPDTTLKSDELQKFNKMNYLKNTILDNSNSSDSEYSNISKSSDKSDTPVITKIDSNKKKKNYKNIFVKKYHNNIKNIKK